MAHFIRINPGESIESRATATSQAFYIIRGEGSSVSSDHGRVSWSEGDLFVFPASEGNVIHEATADSAIYWITDAPLLVYLGVKPNCQKFKPTLFKKERMLAEVENISHEPGVEHRNRMGILLGNKITENNTKTLTHTLWSLLNCLPPNNKQRPHRHNSVALDLCVSAAPEGVYTLMGPELDDQGKSFVKFYAGDLFNSYRAGWVKDPIRCDWKAGSVFVTPPGWWHSHHNETDKPAWVLPMQDAGLYTYQRTLDIKFSV
jgi:gentisate 1,2-dioxygenase